MKQYFRSIIQLPFAVKWFLLTEMIFGLGIGIWSVNLNFHLKACGFTDLGIGSLLAFGSVATACFSIFAGWLCDKVGFHPAMMFGCIMKGSGMVLIAFAQGSWLAYAGLLVASLGDAFVLSSEFPFILSFVEEKVKDMVYNLLICSFLFALFFGNIAGGYLPGIAFGIMDIYFIPVLISGLFFILLGIVRSSLPKRDVDYTAKKINLILLKDKKVLLFLLYSVLFSLAVNLLGSMLNIVFRDRFHLEDNTVGLVFSMATAVMFISAFLVPVITKRLKKGNTAIIVMILVIPLLVLMSFASVNLFVILWVIYSFLRLMLPGTVDCQMLQVIPEEYQGSYSGMRIFAASIGNGIGASLAGAILEYSDYSVLFICCAFVFLMQLITYLFGCHKYLSKDAADNCRGLSSVV
jgi:MFS transporter, DHA1 family, multidrug resistance protein